ncbi:MAG: carboxymuconolactone decarboxylase family protein [Nitrososphaerales archaeon]
MKKSKKFQLGWKKFIELRGEEEVRNLIKPLEEVCPDMVRYSMEFTLAEIWTRGILDYKTRELITIAVLAALGGRERHVKDHIRIGLRNGIKKEEILEVMIQLLPYAGFPIALNGVFVAKEVFEESKKTA